MSRQPIETRVSRIASLARLPVFFALQNRRVVIAGGSDAAAWKVELLAATGAHVALYAEELSEELDAIVSNLTEEKISWHKRPWSTDVFQNAALAILATENDDEARAFRCSAQAAGVPCNVIDRQSFCDFSFGGIVNRSPLIVSISTDGAAPVFGQAVRAKIEAILPQGLQTWAKAAGGDPLIILVFETRLRNHSPRPARGQR